MRTLGLVVLLLVACGDETVGPGPGVCTGKLYDSCADEHGCTLSGMNCRPFGAIQVCTQACTDTCPNDENGATVPCTNQLCAPTAANACTLP